MVNAAKYYSLEYYFMLRHRLFHSFSDGALKRLAKKYTPSVLQKYLLKKTLEKLLEFPENIVIETTNLCNAKCWFCTQPNILRPAGYMKFDLFKKIIDQIEPKRKYVRNIALFMDGEPTL